MPKQAISLLVPRKYVKTVKNALETQNLLDRSRKIFCYREIQPEREELMCVPTKIEVDVDAEDRDDGEDEEESDDEADEEELSSAARGGGGMKQRNTKTEKSVREVLESLKFGSVSGERDAILSCIFYIPSASSHSSNPNPSNPSHPKSTTSLSPFPISQSKNTLHRAVSMYLSQLPSGLLRGSGLSIPSLLSSFPKTYSIYPPMLLLPENSFDSLEWMTFIWAVQQVRETTTLEGLYEALMQGVGNGVTHVAMNGAIPLVQETPGNGTLLSRNPSRRPLINGPEERNTKSATPASKRAKTEHENILRSPISFTPLYGSFGPAPSDLADCQNPTQQDYDSAFWVSVKQNGITQTWAPRYTMFSRGNIKEKARILNLASVGQPATDRTADERQQQQEVAKAGKDGGNERSGREAGKAAVAALDLYAGIGYFAFSYKKAGIDTVIGFELNPWSVEGLRRGAELNKWSVGVVDSPSPHPSSSTLNQLDVNTTKHTNQDIGNEKEKDDANFRSEAWVNSVRDKDFIIFRESNENCLERLRVLRTHHLLPPIRHVNLGLLPDSRRGWDIAVKALDYDTGGWLHVHENMGEKDIAERAEEIRREIEGILLEDVERLKGTGNVDVDVDVRLDHVERVKTYAPGVVHCVVDLYLKAG